MFSRAFGASDFTRFWRYWNPFYGYFLAYFCFAPLRRFAPRPLCLILTFALNGFLFHDLVEDQEWRNYSIKEHPELPKWVRFGSIPVLAIPIGIGY
jgi:hypothetical protein